MDHDGLNLAQSAAYSAIVSLFPALIVAAAIISLLPDTTPIRFQLSLFFDRILPPDVSPLLESYFVASPHAKSTHALFLALSRQRYRSVQRPRHSHGRRSPRQ